MRQIDLENELRDVWFDAIILPRNVNDHIHCTSPTATVISSRMKVLEHGSSGEVTTRQGGKGANAKHFFSCFGTARYFALFARAKPEEHHSHTAQRWAGAGEPGAHGKNARRLRGRARQHRHAPASPAHRQLSLKEPKSPSVRSSQVLELMGAER